MKGYLYRKLRILPWLVIFLTVFGSSCRQKTSEEADANSVEPNVPAVTETKVDVQPKAEPEAVEPSAPGTVETETVEPDPDVETGAEQPDSVAVTVNGVDIYESRIEEMIKPQLERMAASGRTQLPPAVVERLKQQLRQRVLEKMITEELLNEKVKAAGIVVTEEKVMNQIEEMLSQQSTGGEQLTLEDFKALLEMSGQNFDDVKKQIRKGLRYLKLIGVDKISVTPEEAQKYYSEHESQFETLEQVRASHILIKPDTSDPNTDPNQAKAAAKTKAQELLKQIKEEGADFATLAKENSGCPSGAKGGDLDFFGKGRMVPLFEKAAFELEVGQVSDVVETQFGYHIIKVTDHKDAGVTTFEQAEDDIIRELTAKKSGEIASEYIESLKQRADIVYPPGKEPKADRPAFPGSAEPDKPAEPAEKAEPDKVVEPPEPVKPAEPVEKTPAASEEPAETEDKAATE